MKSILTLYTCFLFCHIGLTAQDITADVSPSTGSTGAIDLHVNAGFAPFDFEWYEQGDPATIISNSEDLTELAPGTYCMTVTDALCGIADTCWEVVMECNLELTSEVSASSCAANDGSISVSLNEIFDNINFIWDDIGNGSSVRQDLAPGKYCVTVGVDSCTVRACYDIVRVGLAPIPAINLSADITNTSNPQQSDGSIDLHIEGGIEPYSFEWYDAAFPQIILSTSEDRLSLPEGRYCVRVSDQNCGYGEMCFEVGHECNLLLFPSVSEPPCVADSASIYLFLLLGPFEGSYFIWDDIGSGASFRENLAPGQYCVTVGVDDCTVRDCYDIGETLDSTTLTLSADITSTSNPQQSDGSIDLHIEVGIEPNILEWYDPTSPQIILSTSEDRQSLPEGQYCVRVSDLNCGFGDMCFEVGHECNLTLESEVNAASCTADDGSISVSLVGIFSNSTFTWDDIGIGAAVRQGLAPGQYCVTARVDDCTVRECYDIEREELDISIRIEDITRPDFVKVEDCDVITGQELDNGSITISLFPPNSNYEITWANGSTGPIGQTGLIASNLTSGTYIVTVSDGLCEIQKSIFLFACGRLVNCDFANKCCPEEDYDFEGIYDVVLDNKENVSFAEPCIGFLEISINLIEGIGSVLEGHWDGPNGFYSASSDIYNLCEGQYCYYIDNGCSQEEEFCFNIVNCDINPITVAGETTVACPSYDVGTITLSISGGRPPYDVEWDVSGVTGASPSGLSPGEYCAVVADADLCIADQICFTVNSAETTRSVCTLFCGDEDVKDFGPIETVTDPNDCSRVIIQCSEDEYELDNQFVGTYIGFDKSTCLLAVHNSFTDDICPGSEVFGQSCTDCLFGSLRNNSNLIVNCTVDYCYFPSLDATIVHNIDDFNQFVVNITVGEGSPDCQLQIYDNCTDPTYPAVDMLIRCSRSSQVDEFSCFNLFPLNTPIEGNPINVNGNCPLFSTTDDRSEILANRVKLYGYSDFDTVNLPLNDVYFSPDPLCDNDLFNELCPELIYGTGYDISHEDVIPTDGCPNGFVEGEWGWLDADGNVVSNEGVLVDFETGTYKFFAKCEGCPVSKCWDILDLNADCTDEVPIPMISVNGEDLTVNAPAAYTLSDILWSTSSGDILSADPTAATITTNGSETYFVTINYTELPGDNCTYTNYYLFPDTDGDGISDIDDDCPEYYDPTNCCDVDGDGLCLDVDPCPEDPANLCIDTDGDGIVDIDDDCPEYYDPTDCCDVDGDGSCLDVDPCPGDPTNSCVTDPACCPTPSVEISHSFDGIRTFTILFKNGNVPASCSTLPSFSINQVYSHRSEPEEYLSIQDYQVINPAPQGYDLGISMWFPDFHIYPVDYVDLNLTIDNACIHITTVKRLYVISSSVSNIYNRESTLGKESPLKTVFTPSKNNINREFIEMQIYPNPFYDDITIELSNSMLDQVVLSIYDVHGKKIHLDRMILTKSKTLKNLDMSGYSTGIYFLSITDRDGQIIKTERLIKY